MGLKDFLRQQEVETAKPNTSSNTSTVIKPTSQPSYKSFDDMVKQRARSEVVIKPIQQGIAPVSQGVKGNSLREVMTGTPMPASNKPVARPSNTILPMPQGRMAADARLLNPTAQPKNTINPTELTRQPVPTNNPLSQKILSGKPLTTQEIAAARTFGLIKSADNTGNRVANSLKAGYGDILSTVGGAVRYAGQEDLGNKIKDRGEATGAIWGQNNPNFGDDVVRALPFMLSLMPAMFAGASIGSGIGAVGGASAFGQALIGATVGGALSRPLEALMEAGGTYNDARARGMSVDNSEKAADEVFYMNMGLGLMDIAELGTAFLPAPKNLKNAALRGVLTGGGKAGSITRFLARMGLTGIQEGAEEGIQENIQRHALGNPISFTDPEVQHAMKIGGIFGVGMGTAGAAYRTIKDSTISKLSPEAIQTYGTLVDHYVSTGMTQEQAEEKALEGLAKTPAGTEMIKQALPEAIEKFNQEMTDSQAALDIIPGTDSMEADVIEQTVPEMTPQAQPNIPTPETPQKTAPEMPHTTSESITPNIITPNDIVSPDLGTIQGIDNTVGILPGNEGVNTSNPIKTEAKLPEQEVKLPEQEIKNEAPVKPKESQGEILPGQKYKLKNFGEVEITDASGPLDIVGRNKQGAKVIIDRKNFGKINQGMVSGTAQAVENTPENKDKAGKTPSKEKSGSNKPYVPGKKTTVWTARGSEVEVQYGVVDINDLIASHDTALYKNKDYREELQPRERGRASSELQINGIIQKLNPERLGSNTSASHGAPVVGSDMMVESGNGRAIALKRIYEQNHKNAETYREWLIKNAESFGLSKDEVNKIGNPVLVRVRTSDVDRVRFAQESNEDDVAAMSATEQAKIDATKMSSALLNQFTPNEGGDILTVANRDFVNKFLREIVNPAEKGKYVDKNGAISQEGVTRIKNAIFAKAYGNTLAIEKLAESTDNNVKNITNALLAVAPRMAQMKSDIENGILHPLDITEDIGAAIIKLSFLRENGDTVQGYLRQTTLFGEELSDISKDILNIFDTHKRSAKKLTFIFNNYIDKVGLLGDPNQITIFAQDIPSKAETLEMALRGLENVSEEQQTTLFQDRPGEDSEVRTTRETGSVGETGKAEKTRKPEETGTIRGSEGNVAKIQGRDEITNEEALSRLEQHITQGINSGLPEGISVYQVINEGSSRTEDVEVAKLAADIFGRKFIFFGVNPAIKKVSSELYDKANSMNGINIDGVIMVNADRTNPAHSIVGHEITHELEKDKAIFDPFIEELKKIVSTEGHEAVQAIIDIYAEGGESITEAEAWGEFAGDYIGEEMTNKDFWQRLAKKVPGAVKKAINVIQKMIKKLKGRSSEISEGNSVKQFITDMEKARDLAVDATAKYLEGVEANGEKGDSIPKRGRGDRNTGSVGRGVDNPGSAEKGHSKPKYQLKRQVVQDRRGAFVSISKATESLDKFSRDELLVFLQQLSPNGAWSDTDARAEGQKPLTKLKAINYVKEVLNESPLLIDGKFGGTMDGKFHDIKSIYERVKKARGNAFSRQTMVDFLQTFDGRGAWSDEYAKEEGIPKLTAHTAAQNIVKLLESHPQFNVKTKEFGLYTSEDAYNDIFKTVKQLSLFDDTKRPEFPALHELGLDQLGHDDVSYKTGEILSVGAKIRFQLRSDPPPKKTITAYKMFRVEEKNPGILKPLYVTTEELHVGSWYDAEPGPHKLDKKGKKRALALTGEWTHFADGTKGKSVKYRPGFHGGDIPIMPQVAVDKKKTDDGKGYYPELFMWAEVELSADKDYTSDAKKKSKAAHRGKFVSKDADFDYIPDEPRGFYTFSTNPILMNDPKMKGRWVIAGAMRIKRVLSDTEAAKLTKDAGFSPLERKGGDIKLENFGFDPTTGQPVSDIRFQLKADPFYSKLERTVEAKMPEKTSAAQVLAIIDNPQNVKPEEVKWSGIRQWLQGKGKEKVTKAEVVEFLQGNKLQIEEVEKNDRQEVESEVLIKKLREKYELPPNATLSDLEAVATQTEMDDLINSFESKKVEGTKFTEYTLPGGENYRELLFTLPLDYNVDIKAMPLVEIARMKISFQSAHWNEPNVLAHTRFNERTTPDGKKVLFVEEVQSDWAQQGRDKGFDKVPDAPFKKTWHEFVLKRLIRLAAENNFDYMAWTTGEQQAERYDLSQLIKIIEWEKNGENNYSFSAEGPNGHPIFDESSVTLEEISEVAGRDIARQIATSNKSWDRIEGEGLSVGGEGMKSFYDIGGKSSQNIPSFLSKYVKQWGSKVAEIPVGEQGEEITKQPAIAITPAMKKSALYEGQPMFQLKGKDGKGRWTEAKERGFSRNVRTDENMDPGIRKIFEGNPLIYSQLSNKKTLAKAQAIFSMGYDKALDDWNRNVENIRPEDVPLARMLANEAASKGDYDSARQIISDIAGKLTQSGQFSQAAAILRNADPESVITNMGKLINKLNKQGKKTYGSKWENIELTDKEIKLINDSKDADEATRGKILQDIGRRIAERIPVNALEKWDAWRRIAMLTNFKTHIRNILGNVIMVGMERSSDKIAVALEKAAIKTGRMKKSDRTKVFAWRSDKELVDIVDKDWDAVKEDLGRIGKYDFENLSFLNNEKPILGKVFGINTPWLERLNRFSMDMLNWEDVIFVRIAYRNALGQFMKARGIREVTPEARAYAERRSLEATFKEANKLASLIHQQKISGGLGGKLLDAAFPFTKTPLNIVARAIDYSPAGLIRVIFAKGKPPEEVIEMLAKGLTGMGIVLLGYLLASWGWARGGDNRSIKAENIIKLSGDQPYSIMTPQGSYKFDWAQPVAVPLAMGVTFFEKTAQREDASIETALEAIAAGGDTIFELSVLQGLQDILGGGYGSTTEAIMGLPINYFQQGIPTIMRQTAYTIDDTRRSTFGEDKFDQLKRQTRAQIPMASKLLEPRLDILGQKQKQGNWLQQYFNPGLWIWRSEDPVIVELQRLYDSTKSADMIPKLAPYKFSDNKKEYSLTPKEVTAWQQAMGQMNYEAIYNAVNNPGYSSLSDADREEGLTKIVNTNYNKVKNDYLTYKGVNN